MTNVNNNYLDRFFRGYYHVVDQLDANVGRRIATVVNVLAPTIISSIVFAPGLLLHAYNIHRKIITVPLFITTVIAYFKSVIDFHKAKNVYQKNEIEQAIANSRCHSQNALIIETTDWRQGAPPPNEIEQLFIPLDEESQACRFNLLQLAKTHSIQRIAPRSESELNERLNHLQDNTIDLVWIRGHGNEGGVVINKNFIFNKATTCINEIAKKIRQPASCILSSCETGRGESNIAKSLSISLPNTKIYAPGDIISNGFQDFTKNFSPIFYSQFGLKKVATRIFCSGAESAE